MGYFNSQQMIDRVCDYRGLSKIKKNSKCVVDGRSGKVVGGNNSANLNVKFDDTGQVLNCHPGWRMKIFGEDGDILHQSE